MKRKFASLKTASSNELIVGVGFFIFSLLLFFLINREKLIYILIAILAVLVLAWAQFDVKRWVYLSFLFIPLSPSLPLYKVKLPVSIEFSDIIVWLTILAFIFNYALGRFREKEWDVYLMIPFGIFFFVSAVFSLLSYYRHYQIFLILNGFGHLFKWISYFALYFIIHKTFTKAKDIISLLRFILLAFFLGSLIAIIRYFSLTKGALVLYRVGGLFEGINSYAVVLAILLIFYYNLILQGQAQRIFPLPLVVIFLSFILFSLVLTFSRTGWITLWLFVIFLTFFRGRRTLGIGLIFLSALTFYLMRNPVQRRIEMTIENPASEEIPVDLGERDKIWKTTLKKIRRHPFSGVGFLNFSQSVLATTPHNQYLALIAELSIFGFFAFIYLIYRLLRAIYFLYRVQPAGFFKDISFGAGLVLLALIFASFAGEFFYSSPILAVFLGLFASARVGYDIVNEMVLTQKRSLILLRTPYQIYQGR